MIQDPENKEHFDLIERHQQPKRQRIIWVKKNLIDQTAALSYSLGVSIVHLSMFIVLFMVEKPDLEKALAAGVSDECMIEAEKWDRIIKFCNTTHIVQLIANSYREIFNA